MSTPDVARTRKALCIVVAAAATLFALGFAINGLPSDEVHDRYWIAFVAPTMIGFIVGVVALPFLLWTYRPPRRQGDDGSTLDR